MTAHSPGADPEIQLEQDYLDGALAHLAAMRQRATALLEDLVAAGNPDLDYQAALVKRVRLLSDSPRPLLFGRIDEISDIDEASTPTHSWHIGRRHVEDPKADPIVIDWRAPVAMPFYRAKAGEPMGLAQRRQIMVDRNRVLSVADDLFGGPGHADGDAIGTTRIRGGDALLAELERARTGEMLDIVATIQAEQDEIIRAPLQQTLAVQGGPGTGKTAVGLHRAAFLIYNHPSLTRDGVLVLGPSRAFLRYIAQVLPALGEEAVIQTTIADIAPKAKVGHGRDPIDVRRVKGDPRMSEVLRKALERRRRPLDHDVSLGVRFARATVTAERVNELVATVSAHPSPYKSGRLALRARLTSEVRRAMRASGRLGADEPWFEKELAASDEFQSVLDRLWPTVSPTALVKELLASRAQLAASADGILTEEEWMLLLRRTDNGSSAGTRATTAHWTPDDLPLLDEASFLISGRTRTYGHVIIDEAQDLTPMQFRMVARRAPSGSLTILGDLAQATGPWSYGAWDQILTHLPTSQRKTPTPVVTEELTLGYRAPGRVLDYASRLLPLAAPSVQPTTSIRAGRTDPRLIETTVERLLQTAIAEAETLSATHALVVLITPPPLLPHLAALVADRPTFGLLETDAMTRPITIVAAPAAKGLEFDAVVVMEPAAIAAPDSPADPAAAAAATDARGLRLLYVAMTRPIQHLSIVHAEPLPPALAG